MQICDDPQGKHGQSFLKCYDAAREALNVAVSHKAISKSGDVTDRILDFLQLRFEAFKVSFSL